MQRQQVLLPWVATAAMGRLLPMEQALLPFSLAQQLAAAGFHKPIFEGPVLFASFRTGRAEKLAHVVKTKSRANHQ